MRDYHIFSRRSGTIVAEDHPGGQLMLTIRKMGAFVEEPLKLAKELEGLATYIRRFHGKSHKGKLQERTEDPTDTEGSKVRQ